MLLFSQFVFILKITDVDASDMQNPRLQNNIINKYICKNSKDYVGFSYPEIILSYTIGMLIHWCCSMRIEQIEGIY